MGGNVLRGAIGCGEAITPFHKAVAWVGNSLHLGAILAMLNGLRGIPRNYASLGGCVGYKVGEQLELRLKAHVVGNILVDAFGHGQAIAPFHKTVARAGYGLHLGAILSVLNALRSATIYASPLGGGVGQLVGEQLELGHHIHIGGYGEGVGIGCAQLCAIGLPAHEAVARIGRGR